LNPSGSRFRDLPINNYTLDLRRLFDSLRSENAGVVFVYSQKENKLLFTNNVVKNVLGWSPEKFTQDFQEIVQDGLQEWKNAVSQLLIKGETNTRLVIKTKSGQDMMFQCQLGIIPTGIFRNHVIGVLYPA
jgi:hypothetical protein